ncbi:MAG: hypothetical protein M3Z27_06805 [Actinomycetota bacterium]|nr:hypothetical protein [Actinomycetota bacterium]
MTAGRIRLAIALSGAVLLAGCGGGGGASSFIGPGSAPTVLRTQPAGGWKLSG